MMRFVLPTILPAPLCKRDFESLKKVFKKALCGSCQKAVGIKFVTLDEMRTLNMAFREKDRATDVLSFPFAPIGVKQKKEESYLGDIAICVEFAEKEARQRKVDIHEELIRLIVHGVLHLSGYDHENKKGEREMFSLQERLIKESLA